MKLLIFAIVLCLSAGCVVRLQEPEPKPNALDIIAQVFDGLTQVVEAAQK